MLLIWEKKRSQFIK